jgi:hypothetical protein
MMAEFGYLHLVKQGLKFKQKTEMEKIKEELRKMLESGRIPVFEIEVIMDGEKGWILFDISICEDTVRAEHVALNEAEEESDKIAFKSVDIDPDFSLDWHLQQLLEECQTAIMNSDFVEMV